MYVSIDLNGLRFLHKHSDVKTVCNLVHIECPDLDVAVTPCDISGFVSDLTMLELAMLYRNTTGHDHSAANSASLRGVLADLGQRLPCTDADPFEAEQQAAKLSGQHSPHKYVRGAYTPGKVLELFPLTAERNPDEANVPALQPVTLRTPSAPTVAPVTPRSHPVPAQRAAPTASRGGGRAVIWEVADSMWEKAGKPTSKDQVLALRKRIMDVLESDKGVKRTSASSELGQWQKARI